MTEAAPWPKVKRSLVAILRGVRPDEAEGIVAALIESGFDLIPAHRRPDAFRMNSLGWGAQMEHIRAYVEDRE